MPSASSTTSTASTASCTSTGRSSSSGRRRTDPAQASATCSGSSGNGPSCGSRPIGVRNTRPISNSAASARPCARFPATARSRPGSTAVRSTDSSARSGLVARTMRSSGAPARSRSAGETSERVIASEKPTPTRASATSRRSCCRVVRRPTCPWVSGSVRPICSKPMRRATSSTRSISRSRSGRNVGTTATMTSSLVSSGVSPSERSVSSSMPRGDSELHTSSASSSVPSSAFTRLARRRMRARSTGAGYTSTASDSDLGSGHLDEQLHGAFGVGGDRVGVDAALEARARLAAQLESLGAAGDAHALEVRRLQQDLGGTARHLRRRTAHDPGDGLRHALGVADEEVFARQRALDVVEGGDGLALVRGAHHDAAPGEARRGRTRAAAGCARAARSW